MEPTGPAAGAPPRRSVLRAGLAALAVLPPAAACGAPGGAAPRRAETAPKAPGEKVVLTYWTWWPGLQKVADIWNADHPDIRVEVETVPGGIDGGYAKLFNALLVGSQPDLAQVEYFQIPSFLLEDGLEDLTAFGAAEAEGLFDPWPWEQCSYLGGQYGIPVDTGPMMLFYRADRYREWGIEPPDTWEAYAEAARAVRAADEDSHIESFPLGDADWLAAMCMQAGARWFTPDGDTWVVHLLDDASVKVVRFWEELVRDGALNLTHNIWSSGWMQGLQRGTIGSWTVASWGDAIIKGNDPDEPGRWAAAPLPGWEGEPRAEAGWGGSASVVPRGAAHPYEAAAFAVWLSTDPRAVDAMITECGTGWTVAGDADGGRVRREPDPYFTGGDHHRVAARAAEGIDVDWDWGPTLSSTKEHVGDAFRAALAGGGSFVDAMARVQRRTVADLRRKGLSAKEAG
ncbi:ABC transporter substrate-binding protein [Nocardiopsis composta]|uniref:Multiple sugar transport system substrate-binding protein n=1 Tax=Nocardiopsis composta TaxID=157465 RepID=A0A7W8VCR2_9ACTN|nr:extracellular solute-binding protein [Nocardiopsis composta]MBB5431213.1 multiple sugar transport system substrate-binding protein [Nocardiopsis composta]